MAALVLSSSFCMETSIPSRPISRCSDTAISRNFCASNRSECWTSKFFKEFSQKRWSLILPATRRAKLKGGRGRSENYVDVASSYLLPDLQASRTNNQTELSIIEQSVSSIGLNVPYKATIVFFLCVVKGSRLRDVKALKAELRSVKFQIWYLQ